jgi:hypothetical protein
MDELRTLARVHIGQELRELHQGAVFATFTPPRHLDRPEIAMHAILEVRGSSYSRF